MRQMVIGASLLLTALAVPSNAQSVVAIPEGPKIIVGGYGEVKTMPDIARIEYVVRGEGATSDEAVRAMTVAAARIEAALHAIDPAAEPHTSEVKVVVVKSNDCKEREYGPPQLSTGVCTIAGYVATQSVSVRTGAVKDAGTMVGLAGRGGGLNARIAAFDLRDRRPAQQQALATALSDAASKGAAIAAASRIQLGSILAVSTNGRNEDQEIFISGTRISAASAPPPPPVVVKLVPDPITTSANVSVAYAIGH